MYEIENEEWKDIPNYPMYLVSSEGRVYNKDRDLMLKKDNHNNVHLKNEEGSKTWSVAALMGCVFLGNDINDPFRNRVLFKDNNSSNLSLDNIYIEDTSDLPGEVWKSVKFAANRELKDYYQVSNKGRVKSIKHSIEYTVGGKLITRPYPELIISLVPIPQGYLLAYLSCKDGSAVNASVHRLVASCFCFNPDPENKTQVNHIDGNPSNNVAHNLEWCTPSENAEHAIRTGLRGNWKGRSLRYGVIDLTHNKFYNSLSDLDRAMGRPLGYCSSRLEFDNPIIDSDGNEIKIKVLKDQFIKVHTEGQHCMLNIFPGKEFISLGEASIALGRWEGYISDALNRGGVIRAKDGQLVEVTLIGDAPKVAYNEIVKKRKAAEGQPRAKQRKKSDWARTKSLRRIETGEVYKSMSEASKAMGKHSGYIGDCFAYDRKCIDVEGNEWTFESIEPIFDKSRYNKNGCYFEEVPDKIFGSLVQASVYIGKSESYLTDRTSQGKPILDSSKNELHFHFVDADSEAAYQNRIADYIAQAEQPKSRTTRFACYFEEMPDRIFNNFSEAAAFFDKGPSFIRDRFAEGGRIVDNDNEYHLHMLNAILEQEYQEKLKNA